MDSIGFFMLAGLNLFLLKMNYDMTYGALRFFSTLLCLVAFSFCVLAGILRVIN